jgi:gliding motility associated protien GldN
MRFIFFILILFSNSILSQADLINAKKPSDIENKALNEVKSLEYTDIEENDILWSKVVYEYIDLNEKLNFPLLFPINDEQNKIGRKSLWRVLKEYIVKQLDNDASVLEIYNSDDFSSTDKLNDNEIRDLISYVLTSRKTGDQTLYVKSNEIGGYNIKGIWYFDKKVSQLKYRLLGIQPVGANTENLKDGVANPKLETTYFWIWYPSVRDELNNYLVFNDRNNNNRISFDAILVNRRFSSYIYKYDNVYGDRTIRDYIRQRNGESNRQHQMRLIIESERIKKEILDFDVDMWGY